MRRKVAAAAVEEIQKFSGGSGARECAEQSKKVRMLAPEQAIQEQKQQQPFFVGQQQQSTLSAKMENNEELPKRKPVKK